MTCGHGIMRKRSDCDMVSIKWYEIWLVYSPFSSAESLGHSFSTFWSDRRGKGQTLKCWLLALLLLLPQQLLSRSPWYWTLFDRKGSESRHLLVLRYGCRDVEMQGLPTTMGISILPLPFQPSDPVDCYSNERISHNKGNDQQNLPFSKLPDLPCQSLRLDHFWWQ